MYRYGKPFEDIPNYTVDFGQQVIRDANQNAISDTSYLVYEYRDGTLVQVSCEVRTQS